MATSSNPSWRAYVTWPAWRSWKMSRLTKGLAPQSLKQTHPNWRVQVIPRGLFVNVSFPNWFNLVESFQLNWTKVMWNKNCRPASNWAAKPTNTSRANSRKRSSMRRWDQKRDQRFFQCQRSEQFKSGQSCPKSDQKSQPQQWLHTQIQELNRSNVIVISVH